MLLTTSLNCRTLTYKFPLRSKGEETSDFGSKQAVCVCIHAFPCKVQWCASLVSLISALQTSRRNGVHGHSRHPLAQLNPFTNSRSATNNTAARQQPLVKFTQKSSRSVTRQFTVGVPACSVTPSSGVVLLLLPSWKKSRAPPREKKTLTSTQHRLQVAAAAAAAIASKCREFADGSGSELASTSALV